MPGVCGNCGREIRGEIPRCVYCGWSSDAKLREIAEAGKVAAEKYHCGGTFWPFVSSGTILGFLAVVCGLSSVNNSDLFYAVLCGVFLFFGPVVSAAQFVRRRFLWVKVEPEEGLNLSGRGLVPWESIASVDRYAGLFAYRDELEMGDSGPSMDPGNAFENRSGAGCAMILAYTFVPLIAVLSPWYGRVTLHLKSGDRIVLKDLEKSAQFVRSVRYKIEERQPAD
ncbi:MAG: hypothetical protein ACYTAF_16720 [Planctomycetota bacterium]|jgi:hypothetical protein